MKKRIFAGLLMSIMVLASVMGVSAANSADANIKVEEAQKGDYKIVTGADEFKELKSESADVYNAVVGFNAGTVKVEKMLESAPAVLKAIEGKAIIGDVFELIDLNGGKPNADGKHEITLNVPGLTSKEVVVVHYSYVKKAWETVPVKAVDLDKKTVTAVFDDLSPVAIYAKPASGGAAGTSPSTQGVSSAWMIWSAAALIVLGAGVVVSQKKKF